MVQGDFYVKSTISTITSVPDNQYMTRHTINIGNEYRVLGYNPEMADLDNPRGELIDVIFKALIAEGTA